jgi:hypothetical protein
MFSGAHHQSFREADFRTAGNDMYMPTFHVSFNGPGFTAATGGPSSDRQPERSTPKQRRSRFVQQVSRFFRSAEAGNALSHHPPQHLVQAVDDATYSSQQSTRTPNPFGVDEVDPKSPSEGREPEDDFNVVCSSLSTRHTD